MAVKRAKQGRRVRPDGSVWYYYHKIKCGRHKKPGPKKKPNPPKIRVYPSWDYRIIRFNNKHQQKYIGRYHTAEDAYAAKEQLEKDNANIVFPKEYTNNGREKSKVYKTTGEYLILRKRNENEDYTPQLRNEFGKLVDHTITLKDWVIMDKFPYLEEETFWVYGFDNKTDRKTFEWIYQNLALNYVEDNYNMVNIYLYNNKVIFRYDNKEFNFVICKNVSDAIRMYNLISEKSKKNKQIVLTGGNRGYDYRGKETIEMIREKTGWEYKDIWRKSTRH